MCLIQDFEKLKEIKESSIIEYVEGVYGYWVVSKKAIRKLYRRAHKCNKINRR